MAARIKVDVPTDEQVAQAFKLLKAPMAAACTEAIRDVAEFVSKTGRANIIQAGLGRKFANAWRVNRYPSRKDSIDAAAWAYHKIHYALVFEEGATIRGKPMLWLPTKNAPKGSGAARYARPSAVKGLFSLKSKKGTPILARREGRQAVPLYIGVPTVTIQKKMALRQVCREGQRLLPGFYTKNFRGA